jgi:hypothetical protein
VPPLQVVDHAPVVELAGACLAPGDVLVTEVADGILLGPLYAGEETPETAGPGFSFAKFLFLTI